MFQLVEAMFLQNAGFSAKSTFSKHADELSKNIHSKLILQDKQLQEMSDHGMCLSMHQVKNVNCCVNDAKNYFLFFKGNTKYPI